MLFAWIRRMVREAVLGGVKDALDALEAGGDGEEAPGVLPALQRRLTLSHINGEAKELAQAVAGRRREK